MQFSDLRKYAVRLLLPGLLLPLRIQVFFMAACCLVLIAGAVRDKEYPSKRDLLLTLLPGLVYFLLPASLPFTEARFIGETLFQLEQKSGLLIMPLAVCLMGSSNRRQLLSQLPLFAFATLFVCCAANLGYLIYYGGQGHDHVHYRLFFESISGMHPTYMGMFLCFSMAILMLDNRWEQRLRGWVSGAAFFFLFLSLFSLLPKAAIIAAIAVAAIVGYANLNNKKRFIPHLSGAALAVIASVILVPASAQRISEVVRWAGANNKATDVATNSMNMRELIWKIDLSLLQKHWLFGLTPGGLDQELTEQYFFYSMLMRFPLGIYNTHNEYLNQWLRFGLIGFLVFIVVLLLQFRFAIKHRQLLYLCLLIIFSIVCFTENVLSRQQGLVFYAFFASLLLLSSDLKRKDYPAKGSL